MANTYAGNTTIANTVTAITGNVPITVGIAVKSDPANSGGTIYVGVDAALTAATGYPLSAGQETFFSAGEIRAVANTTGANGNQVFGISPSGSLPLDWRVVG